MTAIILSIGDELVLGQTVDTNSAWLSQQLAAVGVAVLKHVTVGDGQKVIEEAVRDCAWQCDYILISGGIGPTPDDLTRQALAAVMGEPLEMNETWLKHLEEFFRQRNRPMPDINKIQAMIPRGATMIFNHAGTAAGIMAKLAVGRWQLQLFEGKGSAAGLGHMTASVESMQRLIGEDADFERRLGEEEAKLFQWNFKGRPLGRILTKAGLITRDQLVQALAHQKAHGGALGEILIRFKHVRQDEIDYALAAQQGNYRERPPSLRASIPSCLRTTCSVFVMPGVPKEMKIMFERSVLPIIRENAGGAVILSKTLHTFGLGESAIAEMLGLLMDQTRNPSVGTTVANGIVSLRINSRFDGRDEAQRQLEETEKACRAVLGDLIFGQEEDTLPQIIARLLAEDSVAKQFAPAVATAESCTGGLLAKMLTDIPGSSRYFRQGYITYSNEAKSDMLNVPEALIAEHGAVSEPVVAAMAKGAQQQSGAAYALSISGVAGPEGGTPAKPVGTVCFGMATPAGIVTRTFPLFGDRETVRDRAAKMALTMLRFHLLGKPLPF